MQTLNYSLGKWLAEARVEQVDDGKLLAVISVSDAGTRDGGSRHTVVFEHESGADAGKETEDLVHRLLRERYGAE